MFLTTSLPLLPPPSASFLPPLTTHPSDMLPPTQPSAQHQQQHHSRRAKPPSSALSRNNTLVTLSSDERTVAQRKMAIAMYGYSWLKPAGCAKTMLGRREEDVEREEVEKQLREAEMQEMVQREREEQERLARLGETGEIEVEGERDLDEDIPDADEGEEGEEGEGEGEEEGFGEGEDEEGMEGDLDDEIPDADDEDDDEVMSPDPEGVDANWAYDTRREPDTDSEAEGHNHNLPVGQGSRLDRTATVAGVRIPVPGSEYDYDEREAEDLANAMLDEDEIFDDDDAAAGERDLDNEIPDPEPEQTWEHTDTELEEAEETESEMDISVLPSQLQAQPIRARLGNAPRRSSGRVIGASGSRSSAHQRRSSGPWIADPSPPPPPLMQEHTARYMTTGEPSSRLTPQTGPAHDRPRTRGVSGNLQRQLQLQQQQQRQRQYIQTPAMLDSPLGAEGEVEEDIDTDLDPFASSNPRPSATARGAGRTATQGPGATIINNDSEQPTGSRRARNWFDGAAIAVGGSARRTLFSRVARRGTTAADAGSTTVDSRAGAQGGSHGGGLFTPSSNTHTGINARATTGAGAGGQWDTPVNTVADATGGQSQEEGSRRSGRFLRGRRRGE